MKTQKDIIDNLELNKKIHGLEKLRKNDYLRGWMEHAYWVLEK